MTDSEKNDPDEQNIMLAGEYVMGMLTLEQQQAVKDSLHTNPLLKYWVDYWEAHLPQLYSGIASKPPALRVWKKIKQHIQSDTATLYTWQKTPWWQGMTLWRGLAIASILCVVSLTAILRLEWLSSKNPVIAITEKTPPIPLPHYVAVVRNDKNQAFWHISLNLTTEQILVTSLQSSDLPKDKSYELWLLSKDKQTPPRSLGLMPRKGSQQLALNVTKAVLHAEGLAVSLEPLGGSPSSTPTGPVMFQATLTHFI